MIGDFTRIGLSPTFRMLCNRFLPRCPDIILHF